MCSSMIGNSAEPNRKRLFFAANLAMFMIGLGFAVRANIATCLQRELFDRLDLADSTHMVGEALGITFTGFAVTLLFGRALVDLVGGRRVLAFSVFGFVGGSILVLMASALPIGSATFPLVLVGLLLHRLGLGKSRLALIRSWLQSTRTTRLTGSISCMPGGPLALHPMLAESRDASVLILHCSPSTVVAGRGALPAT